MKKITVSIASKDYTITLDKSFAAFFENDMERFLDNSKGIDVKELLTAFVQKSYEGYRQEEMIQQISSKIDSIID